MKGPKDLYESEHQWKTRMGGLVSGERVVFRGADLHADLNEMDWMRLYLYSITGRQFTGDQVRVLNALWTYTSYPDPRIWNNRVTALAGSVRSTATLALSAAVGVSEASIYGHRPSVRAIDFLLKTKGLLDNNAELIDCIKKELRQRRTIAGFGRPLFRADERIPHVMMLVEKLEMHKGTYVCLALEIERLLLAGRWRMQMNIGGLGAALCADMGFSPREFQLFKIPCFLAGMTPIFLESSQKKEGSFFPYRCTRIHYEGVDRRNWG